MTAPERVNQFLTGNSGPVCSDCIAVKLEFPGRAPTSVITAALATTRDFVRGLGHCIVCKRHKMVTQRS